MNNYRDYLVNMVSPQGKRKNIVVEAHNCQGAIDIALEKYSSYEVVRVSDNASEINYFDTIKNYKGKKNG